jgi:hypothetical protein
VNSPTLAFDANNIDSILAAMQQPEPVPETGPEPEPRKREPSPFELRAIPMIERGIPVIPLAPRTKIAFQTNWTALATTDPGKVAEIGTEFPDANAACVAQAVIGGKWFFEVDNPEVLGMIEETVKIPETFTVSSSPGKAHFYFDQTNASIEMGNLQGKDIDGKESWSARVDNRYVVAAGSIHPTTGKAYTITNHAPLVPAPLWLVDWLKDNAFNSSKNSPEGARVNASPDGPAIPRGSHDNELFRSACLLRNAGMGYEQIRDNLIMICEQRCVDHGSDYVDMCEKKAVQACKYPVGKASPIPVMGSSAGTGASPKAEETADVSNWRSLFRNVSEMEQGEIEMVIAGVLQEEGTCFLGASAGHGKTLLALSLAKAITLGQPLFGIADYVVKEPRNVIYLIPESGDKAFRKRCEAFGLPKDDRFLARTISSGGPLDLPDPLLIEAVRQKKPVVFLDTASRFMHGDENSSAENRMLVNDVITLRAAGALAVVLLHHATKAATEKREAMTLANMLRGTGDFGAMCDTAYGLRVNEHLYSHGAGPMELELVNLKDRERLGGLTSIRLAATYKKPGVILPPSYINEKGDFHPVDFKETKDRTRETLIQLVEANHMMSIAELSAATNLTGRKVREMLQSLGWHAAKGGPDKRSPWHKDEGRPCPYEEAKKKGEKVVDFGESEPVFKPPVRLN